MRAHLHKMNHKHRRRRSPAPATTLHLQPRLHLLAKQFFSLLLLALYILQTHVSAQQADLFLPGHSMDNLRISESLPVDSVVHQLKAVSGSKRFSYHLTTDILRVNETTGEVRLAKQLDRERESKFSTFVLIRDLDNSADDRAVENRLRTVIVEDVDDSWPIFEPHNSSVSHILPSQATQYHVEILETAPVNSVVIADIKVSDADEGKNAEIEFECRAKRSTNSACDAFSVDYRLNKLGRYSVTVRTRSLLDYERTQSFKLSLIAKGKKPSPITGKPLETEAIIFIDVINVQDEVPAFLNAPYTVSIRENLKPETRLLNLLVQDGDSAPQRDISMVVVNNSFSRYFQVIKDPILDKVWYLQSNDAIDREDPAIQEVNGIFTISLLAVELDKLGQPIASGSELRNALKDDPLSPKGTIKRETVNVIVVDLPDTEPVFVHASSGKRLSSNVVVFNLSESIPTGSSIPDLDLAVFDVDQGINSKFNLSLVDLPGEPRASRAFKLESEVIYGQTEVIINIVNSSLLDYENPSQRYYKFELVASKDSDPSLRQVLEVQINIVDANDNAPEFEKEQYILQVPEGTIPGTLVASIKANDRDSAPFGMVRYALYGSGAERFELIPDEGQLLVNQCGIQRGQCLDYEQQSVYSLTYEARDGGGLAANTSLIINIVNVNDHAPVFSEPIYRCELISDNLSSKHSYISPQLIVRARDEDELSQVTKNITYRIKSSNLTNLDIDPNSGLVYLAQPLDLDNMISSLAVSGRIDLNRKIIFEADVIAEDNGKPMQTSTAKIILTVRGNPEGAPRFKHDNYHTTVFENQPVDKPFFRVQASDPDDNDSQLRYSLGYDLNDIMDVNALTGDLSFKTKVDYDDFKGAPYNISVYATDNSRPYPLKALTTVSILIQDINDKKPQFEEKEYRAFLVQGKTKANDIVLQVKAIDPDKNSLLNYSIEHNHLTVHDRNGQQFSLDELANTTTGYLSQMSKTDRNQLLASLSGLFRIDKSSGAIRLKSEPDYSFAAAMTILVRVTDLNQETASMGQQDFASCTFFFQTRVDRSPIFAAPWTIEKMSYNISILEELNPGTVIFSLLAKDPWNNNRIETYEKSYDSDPKEYFRVDRSGIIYVNRRIDYEELPATKLLSLTVKAITDTTNDESHHSTATLFIKVVDLNDNTPQFKSQNYTVSVSESVVYPQKLLTVEAEDRDSHEFNQVHYSLSGYSSAKFVIDPQSGSITPREGVKLDRDTEQNHILLVAASDCPEVRQTSPEATENFNCKKSSAFVNISLIDENDNDPIFINVNKQGELETLISETVSVGSVIAHLVASDIDEGLNGLVGYEIVKNGDHISRLFGIDKEGFVRVSESLSGLGRPVPYRIPIRAYDHGKPDSRQSFATIMLTINDVVTNDGVPRFVKPKPDEIISLSESTGPGAFVYEVQAVDPDEEASGKVTYKLVQASDVFEIDPFTGIIRTQQRVNLQLDRELREDYTLIVLAQDFGSPVKQAHQVLTIRITDVNDNEPYFERGFDDPPLVLEVREEVPKDHLVGTIQAMDKDEGLNAMIGYEILDGNLNNLFRLESESIELGRNPCNIYTNGRLDREMRESYTLTIKATSTSRLKNPFINQLKDPLGDRNPFNQYNGTDLAKIRVTIKLLDINDNRPTFSEQNPKIVVDSSAEIYSQLMVMKASDADSSNSEVQYSILDILFYSESKYHSKDYMEARNHFSYTNQVNQPISLRHVFDIDLYSGILRNSVPLKSYVDGYFVVFVKADTGSFNTLPGEDELSLRRDQSASCINQPNLNDTNPRNASSPYNELESCFVAINKATIFITHQRETFRFVFNKTKLNDRFDEFKTKVQQALEKVMFEPSPSAQASTDSSAKAEARIHLNTLNTDFYEREDGSLDFSILTSCSQLVKFDDDRLQTPNHIIDDHNKHQTSFDTYSMVPNQVINFNEVLNLFKVLNSTQPKQQKNTLFSQYGLIGIERCLNDKALYRMSLSERVTLYFAAMIAVVSLILAFIVSRMRKGYEKNLKLLQRSKYQYMNQYATLHPGLAPARPLHHMSLNGLHSNNFVAPNYVTQMDFGGSGDYDSWQM